MHGTVKNRAMVVDGPDEFLVATSAYRGQEIFDQELQRIFYSTWIFLCHESEIANPGDFKSTWIGRQPIIVARDRSGKVGAFLNFCRHRGAAVCRYEYGNTKAFVCPYHGWSYRTSGELMTITDPKRYPPGLKTQDNGLIKVAKLEIYGGLVFGCLNDSAPSLENFLGGAKRHIDYWLGRTAGGSYSVKRAHKYKYQGNWKLQSENVIDGYHPGIVHRSAFSTFNEFSGSDFPDVFVGGVQQGGATRGFPGGHSTLEGGFPTVASALASAEVINDYKKSVVAVHGDDANEVLGNRHLLIFPNLALMDFNIRVIQPIAPDCTDVYSYPLHIEGAQDEINTARLSDVQMRLGTAGMVGADDIEIFAAAQTGLMAESAEWIVLSRGLAEEKQLASGERVGEYSDEVPQRAFWRRWSLMMSPV
jgi:nitrite reductase/ring-hydroxylating ferredoxin subunit